MKPLLLLRNCLQAIIDKIDEGTCEADNDSIIAALEYLNRASVAENKYSKYQACKYLKVSRATFDNWVREGKLPPGRKQQGFTEKFWLLSDLKNISK